MTSPLSLDLLLSFCARHLRITVNSSTRYEQHQQQQGGSGQIGQALHYSIHSSTGQQPEDPTQAAEGLEQSQGHPLPICGLLTY